MRSILDTMKRFPRNSILFRVLAGTLTVTILITASLISFSLFSRRALIRQAQSNNDVYSELLANQLSHSLSELEEYLDNIYYVNENFLRITRSDNPNDRFLYAQSINQAVRNYLSLYDYGILFYITASDFQSPTVSTLSSSVDKIPFSDYLRSVRSSAASGTMSSYGKRIETLGGIPYLSIYYSKKDLHLGVLVDIASLLATVNLADNIDESRILLTDAGMAVLADSGPDTAFSGSVITSEYALSDFPLCLSVTVPERAFLENLALFQYLLVSLSVMAVLSFLLYFLFQQWKVFRPLLDLRNTLRRINEGDLNTRLDSDNPTRELSEIYQTINTYIDHVTALRTQTYEERLNRQNIEIQFLHLQLRPHFFLNSLKGIYALAENCQFTDIQEYVLCLSNHFRFLLYDTTKRIELSKELMHTQNYMKMQRIGLNNPDIACSLQINGVNENTLVPPLILQTFMENSIKYAVIPGKPLQINIHIQRTEMEEGRPMIDFSFRDNGPGFSQDILSEIEKDEDEFFAHHKGFGNLRRRLQLIYGGASEIYVYNYPSGGAAVEILIPQEAAAMQETGAERSAMS